MPVTAATEPPDDPVVRVGRYILDRKLGSSPRGDLHVAVDPKTDRRVAIKLLRRDAAAGDTTALRGLAHRNVIPVLDAGVADGRGFLVMPLVDAAPIDRWARDRRAAQIVAAFRAAGRGLAAAHAAGLVHGAVAASNILVDRDGLARITDFVVPPPPDASPAADQRAFATALHDALGAAGVAAVSRRVRSALDRARAPDPAARFPSLAALVAALAPSRRGVVFAIAGAVAIAAAAVAAIAWPGEPSPAPVARAAPPVGPPVADLVAAYPLTDESGACSSAPIVLDDNTVVYDRTSGDDVNLYSVALPDGAPHPVTHDALWAWRANRGVYPHEVVYVISDPSDRVRPHIAELQPRTGDTLVLPQRPDADVRDAIGFAGNVLYAADDGIHQVDARGDRLYRQLPGDRRPLTLTASNDDRWVATNSVRADGTFAVCTIDTQGTQVACIDQAVGRGRPAFGSVGAWLYFSDVDGVWWHDQQTGKTARVERKWSAPGGIAVTADGRALVLSRCQAHSRIVDAARSPPAVVVDDAFAPSLAADDTLAYLAQRETTTRVFVRFPDGRVVQLAVAEAVSGEATAISRDGRRVAYVGAAPHTGIGIADTGGAAALRRTAGDDHVPRWVDDDRLLFTRFDGARTPATYVVPARGGEPVLVADHASGVAVRRGEVLAVRDGVAAWHDLATGRERASGLPAGIRDATASPSGRWLLYESEDERVWRVDLDAVSPPELILAVPRAQAISHFAVDNDGRVLVAPIVWTGDLVVVPAAAGRRF